MEIEVTGPKVAFVINGIPFSETCIVSFLLLIVLSGVIIWLGRGLKVVPETKKQVVAEFFVTFFNNTVRDVGGDKMMRYAPYIACIFSYALTGSLISMLGFRSMTADICVTGTWAALTFVLITYNKIKANGFLGYLDSFTHPKLMTPMNIVSEFATPCSMALRMFGNIAGGMIITTIIYAALSLASSAIYNLVGILPAGAPNYFSIFSIGIPAVFSIYFDLFSGTVQSYLFIMLTLSYVSMAAETD